MLASTNWLGWVVVILIAGVAVLAVLFVATLLLAGRFEKRYVRKLVRLRDEEGPVARNAAAAAFADEAIALGFHYLGAFRDEESGVMKTRIDLFLSDDGLVVLLIPSMVRTLGYRMKSRMPDDVWLISAEMAGTSDLSGTEQLQILPGCTMAQVLRFHRDRIADHSADAVAFDPETLTDDLYELELIRTRSAIEQGLARWISEPRRCYTGTWRNAFGHLGDLMRTDARLNTANELAARYKADPDGP